jgi:hypothetical protein
MFTRKEIAKCGWELTGASKRIPKKAELDEKKRKSLNPFLSKMKLPNVHSDSGDASSSTLKRLEVLRKQQRKIFYGEI